MTLLVRSNCQYWKCCGRHVAVTATIASMTGATLSAFIILGIALVVMPAFGSLPGHSLRRARRYSLHLTSNKKSAFIQVQSIT